MRHMLISKNRRQHGFTMVEIIVLVSVVAILTPIVLNVLGQFYLSNVTTISQSTQNTDARSVLRTIEKDLAYSPGFLASQTVTDPLLGPNNSASGSTTWSANRDKLIAYTYTTTTVAGQQIPIPFQRGSDDCSKPTTDMMLRNTVIYFVDTDPNNSSVNNLYRRTLVGTTPNGTACPSIPTSYSQRTTCRATVTTGSCTRSSTVASDAVVFRNINTLSVRYYAEATSTTPLSPSADPASAVSAELSILPKKQGNVTPEEVTIRLTPIR